MKTDMKKTAEAIGFLGKKSFSSFVDYNCDRKLYFDLGNLDPNWIQRPVKVRAAQSDTTHQTKELGKEFENLVYQRLYELFPQQIYAHRNNDIIKKISLNTAVLQDIQHRIQTSNSPQIGLELEFPIDPIFVHTVFGSDSTGMFPSKGNEKPRSCRPDIVIFGPLPNDANRPIYELLANGEYRKIKQDEQRIGISIIDIKNSQHDRIGLRHFSELLFYSYAMRFYLDHLQKNGFGDNFYVRVSGHSILGRMDLSLLQNDIQCLAWSHTNDVQKLEKQLKTSPLIWEETHELFQRFQSKVRQLWIQAKSHRNVDKIDVRMQKKCARCPFVDDCITQLKTQNNNDEKNARGWDIRLLPLLKMDVAQQIITTAKEHSLGDMQTIGALYDNLERLQNQLGNMPTPLHAEINSLHTRTKALLENRIVVAEDGYFSKYLPNQINMALVFNLEKEDLHDIVFAYALHFSVISPFDRVNKNLRERHNTWWNHWIDIVLGEQRLDFDTIASLLDMEVLFHNYSTVTEEEYRALSEEEKRKSQEEFHAHVQEYLVQFQESFQFLFKTGALNIKKDGIRRKNAQDISFIEPQVELSLNYISSGFDEEEEFHLLIDLIDVLFHVMTVCIITEKLTVSTKFTEGYSRVVSESFAGFYWSSRQVEVLRELLERHLLKIRNSHQDGSRVYNQFTQILQWFAPAETGILNYNFFEKIYDIELFMKHAVAFPEIIAYSWHEIIKHFGFDVEIDNRYWIPHYNFIDFTTWYNVVNNNQNKRIKHEEENKISKQLHLKMDSISKILFELYRKSKGARLLPPESKTVSTERFLDNSKSFYNSVARVWYSYTKLNAIVSEVEVGMYRNTWTDYSIAKLRAGSISSFAIEEDEEIEDLEGQLEKIKVFYQTKPKPKGKVPKIDYTPTTIVLLLKDLSQNMKIKAGDRVQILHEDKRDSCAHRLVHVNTSNFNVDSVTWDDTQDGYLVRGTINIERMYTLHMHAHQFPALDNYQVWKMLYHQQDLPTPTFFSLLVETKKKGWHLHHQESDVWSQRLSSILGSFSMGTSWLGNMLALEKGFHNSNNVDAQQQMLSDAREVYLYRPSLLPQNLYELGDSLRTQIKYAPDSSQQKAILSSLSHTVSCIQGPPGTGKSQTIVALLDEFIIRFKEKHKREPKILISAFSYAALEVLFEKVYESREGEGIAPDENRLSPIAKMPIIFGSSASRILKTIENVHGEQFSPVSLQRSSNPEKWYVNGEEIEFSKNRYKKTKVYLFARVFEQSLFPFVSPAIEEIDANGKKKTKAQKTEELKNATINHFEANDARGFVLFANAHFLYNLGQPDKNNRFKKLHNDFGFDLVIIDEASQMPADHFTAIARLVHLQDFDIRIDPIRSRSYFDENGEVQEVSCATAHSVLTLGSTPNSELLTQIVLVGDHNQLPPIQQVKPSEKMMPIVGSVFQYFMDAHQLPTFQLSTNYRSHEDIVDCIRQLELYHDLTAQRGEDWVPKFHSAQISPASPSWITDILNPNHVVVSLLHQSQWDTALSSLEADMTAAIVVELYKTISPQSESDEIHFWQHTVGIVAPHNAHANLISRNILWALSSRSKLTQAKLKENLDTTIYSVEKFQGSDRSVIIGSMGVSSLEQLQSEEEFLYNINRFNVLISRAKHKMIFICSQNFAQYVPQKRELMNAAHQVRKYTDQICNTHQDVVITLNQENHSVSLRIKK